MSLRISELEEGELRYLAIVLRNAFSISRAEVGRQYGGKYAYELEKKLIEKRLIELKDSQVTLTDRGVIFAIRSFMLLEDLNNEVANYLVNHEYKRVVNYLQGSRHTRITSFTPIFSDMLRVLGRMDELFRDLHALREMPREGVRKYVATYVKRVLANVFRYDKLLHQVVDSWMEEYGFANIDHPVNQILSSKISEILFYVSSYSYSPFRWTLKFPISDLLIRTGALLMIIALSVIVVAQILVNIFSWTHF
jgi:hypothetical protein